MRRDSANHYTGFSEFRVLIDPAWIQFGNPLGSFTGFLQLAGYANAVTTPLRLEFLYPEYLEQEGAGRMAGVFFHGSELHPVPPPTTRSAAVSGSLNEILREPRQQFESLQEKCLIAVTKASAVSSDDLHLLVLGGVLFRHEAGVDLFHLCREHDCDYLVTNNPWILRVSDQLRDQLHIWAMKPGGVLDNLQLAFRATGVFIDVLEAPDVGAGTPARVRSSIEGLGFGSFYHMENPALQRLLRWANGLLLARTDVNIDNHIRAAFYHRFPYLLYAADMVRHHSRAMRHFNLDEGCRGDHRFFVGYHLNVLYVHLSGLLDNIAWIWNYVLGLGFTESVQASRRGCVLGHKQFKATARPKMPDLVALIEESKFATWLDNLLELKRHPAIHRLPLFPTTVMERETGRVLTTTASILVDDKGFRLFDTIDHASEDVRILLEFCEQMSRLALPGATASNAQVTGGLDDATETGSDHTAEEGNANAS